MTLASELVQRTRLGGGLLDLAVGARKCRLEAPFLEEIDIGLGTGALVLLVGTIRTLLNP